GRFRRGRAESRHLGEAPLRSGARALRLLAGAPARAGGAAARKTGPGPARVLVARPRAALPHPSLLRLSELAWRLDRRGALPRAGAAVPGLPARLQRGLEARVVPPRRLDRGVRAHL